MTAVLLLVALLGGTLFTYLFDEDAPLTARLAAGVPVGLATLGLAGFVAASLLGLGPAALVAAAAGAAWPLPVFAWRAERRMRLRADLAAAGRALARPDAASLALAAGFVLTAALVWRVFDRAMFMTPAGILTGDDHNLGDLAFHLGIVTSFADGANYPPQHPELSGTRLTYPFLVDMLSALLLRAGARLPAAFFWPNVLLAVALAVLLYHWSRLLTRDRLAAALTPVLVLLSGGLGWVLLVGELASGEGWDLAHVLRRDYTIEGDGPLRWGNALTTLLIPQRSLLLGLPLFLTVASGWWRAVATEPDDRRRLRLMAGAGIVAGLLPLSHAHSFALALALGGALALLFPRGRAWAAFFLPALAIAAPQLVWSAHGSALQTRAFFGWHFGWDRGESNAVWFWLYNTGLFIPLLLVALALRRRLLPSPLPRFYLPFTLCFVAPNLLRLSPWIWDNVKFLFYWYVASAPLVALALSRMARGPWPARTAATVLLLALVLAGALDVSRVASGRIAHVLFDDEAVAFGQDVARATPPGSVIAARPTHDSPVLLSGRPSLLGYTGHIWSQGLDAGDREQDLENLYAGTLDPAVLRDRYGVGYVVLEPSDDDPGGDDAASWRRAAPLVEQGRYRLLRVPEGEVILEPD
ncbi:MAG TPA: hypothetical protein VMT87_10820 [Vicinamibacteria bacterium]|nr:hypothetical protein [Vicinamibacteria bacterium]